MCEVCMWPSQLFANGSNTRDSVFITNYNLFGTLWSYQYNLCTVKTDDSWGYVTNAWAKTKHLAYTLSGSWIPVPLVLWSLLAEWVCAAQGCVISTDSGSGGSFATSWRAGSVYTSGAGRSKDWLQVALDTREDCSRQKDTGSRAQ